MSIAVIILTLNEEIHIKRCIENAKLISNEIYVIDSNSSDNTVEISKQLGANVYVRDWPGNQALQFNWALDNINIEADWILRLDADEYLLPDLVHEINNKLPNLESNITGVSFKLRLYFLGKWIKKGAYPNSFLRLFRKGIGRSDLRMMDEHIILSSGHVQMFDNDFVDHNLNDFSWWLKKHINYADREVRSIFYSQLINQGDNSLSSSKKDKFLKFPIFLRSILFFFYRYIVKGGFLEGKESFIWNFFQGLWYRMLIDTKIWIIKRKYSSEEIISKLKSEEKL